MKITKRQLKRIIKEEYRRIIRENIRDTLSMASGLEDYEVEEMSPEFFVDQLMQQEYESGQYANVDEMLNDGAVYDDLAMTAMAQFPQLTEEEFRRIWYQAGFVHHS